MTEGIFTLLGVTLGVIATAWIDRRQRDTARAETRRTEVLDLVSSLLVATDALWVGTQDLVAAVAEIQADRTRPDGWERRDAALQKLAPVRPDARLTVARMRILAPGLVPTAEALVEASESLDLNKYEPLMANRSKALAAFESAAAALVK